MHVYIPILPIAVGILVYLVIGALLFVPFVYIQRRYISGWKNRSAWEGVKKIQALAIVMAVWPVMLAYTIHTEIDYRKKGYL